MPNEGNEIEGFCARPMISVRAARRYDLGPSEI